MTNLKMMEYRLVFHIFDEFNNILEIITFQDDVSDDLKPNKEDKLNAGESPDTFAGVFKVDGYFLSTFVRYISNSSNYYRVVRNNFIKKFKNCDGEINTKFQLVKPKLEIIDFAWNDRICGLVYERQELEHAMSWLSTLGGAFSALGDDFENCAKVAGKISIQQFKIAFRLGEPPLVARCRLYMALSLLQLGKLDIAKTLVEEQYLVAKNLNDFRLKNMCKGIWAKLQYVYKQKKLKKVTV